MAAPQYQRIHQRITATGQALPSELNQFSSRLAQAVPIEGGAHGWLRLDRIARSDEEIFRSIAHSIDAQFALDADGNIYVSTHHAICILEWELERTRKRLDVSRNWAYALSIVLALALLASLSG